MTAVHRCFVGLGVFACLLVAARAQASPRQDAASPASVAAPQSGDTPDSERVDLVELVRTWRKKPTMPAPDATGRPGTRMVLVPIIGAKPSTGLRIGVGANIEIAFGDATSRLSSLNTSFTISTKKQVAASFQPLFYGRGEKWLLVGENQITNPGLSDVPTGALAPEDAPVVSYRLLRFFDTYARRVAGHLYAGGGIFYARQSHFDTSADDGATSTFVDYSTANGFDLDSQVAAGPSVSVIFDSRDHPNDATRGLFVEATYRLAIDGFFGSDAAFRRVVLDARAYHRLGGTDRQRLAIWGLADVITSGAAPYLSLPNIGGDLRGRSGRGYAEGQLRGERIVSLEGEYRSMLMRNGLIGLAVFANASTVGDPATGVKLFDKIEPGGGAGLRFQLQKRSRTNLCVDFGVGRHGSHGFYLGLMDTF